MDKLPKKQIGLIGLGKMGTGLAQNLLRNQWEVAGYDSNAEAVKSLEPKGIKAYYSVAELVQNLSKPRVVWIMVKAGDPVQQVLFGKEGLVTYLEAGDIVIDGGNSYFEDSIVAATIFDQKNISFLDVGIGNGPEGAQFGACMMIGGQRPVYSHLEQLFKDLCVPNGYKYVGKSGSGHFIKLMHNAVVYGYSQVISEAFDLIKLNGKFEFNLAEIATLYNSGSLIQSKLMEITSQAFNIYGDGLGEVHSIYFSDDESQHIKQLAHSKATSLPAIEQAIDIREEKPKEPSYQARLVMAIRSIYGGHELNK